MRELDIVRENRDLEFPDNVEYDFLYWQHVPENYEVMLDAIKGYDIIATECVGFTEQVRWGARHRMRRQLKRYNQRLRDGPVPNNAHSSATGDKDHVDWDRAVVDRYAGSGKKLYYIDAWEHTGNPNHITQNTDFRTGIRNLKEYFASCASNAQYMAARESIALRQLADIGQEHAPHNPGESVRIAVVYGAAHSYISVAANALGAHISRDFLTDGRVKTFHFPEILSRAMRLYGIESEEAASLYAAQYMAFVALDDYDTHQQPGARGDIAEPNSNYFRTHALLTTALLNTAHKSHWRARVIRAHVEESIGSRPLDLEPEYRPAFTRLYQDSVRSYVVRAEKIAKNNL